MTIFRDDREHEEWYTDEVFHHFQAARAESSRLRALGVAKQPEKVARKKLDGPVTIGSMSEGPAHIRTDRRGRWHARDGRYLKRVAKDPA